MKKIMVIGCCGAGKSTLAKALHKLTDLPVYHLDQFYWKANWVETPKQEWEPKVLELAKKSAWIIDGNYGSTMDIRIQRADTIIYLDYPTYKCLWRVIKRIIKYKGTTRPDMTTGCKERFDFEFLHYVAVFNLVQRKKILAQLEKRTKQVDLHIFKSDKQSSKYLRQLKSQLNSTEPHV